MSRSAIALVVSALLLAGGAGSVAAGQPGIAPTAESRAGNTTKAPTGLRVDGQAHIAQDPLVSSSAPSLGWVVNDSGRSEQQSAYQIRVSEVPSDTGARTELLWDSTQTRSSESIAVTYGGPALQSDHTYQWSVRTWNSRDQRSAWSAPERFDVGLLSASDWSAAWLPVADGALARTTFDLPTAVARARLYVGAQGVVEPHVNGTVVEPDRFLDNSATDFTERVVYRSLDVTASLHQGANALGFVAGRGSYRGTPTVVAQLSITYTDGSHATFGTGTAGSTDNPWTTSAGPVTGNDFYYGESYDARQQQKGWDTADFDDTEWTELTASTPVVGDRSLAAGRPVTALDETACCGWSRAALVDGIDHSTDASQGYHSTVATTAASPKWVQVDLGSSQNLRTVTLFPAHPTNDPAGDFPGRGFPVRYRVQVSDDPSLATSTTFADRSGSDQPNPGLESVTLTGDSTGRYLRVAADVLDCKDGSCTFRLAELAAYGAHPEQGFATAVLDADTTPPMQIEKSLAPVTTTQVGDGTVYDFGQNYVGQITLEATAPAGTEAIVTKGEILDAEGHVSTANISFAPSEPKRQSDKYTFDGSGA